MNLCIITLAKTNVGIGELGGLLDHLGEDGIDQIADETVADNIAALKGNCDPHVRHKLVRKYLDYKGGWVNNNSLLS